MTDLHTLSEQFQTRLQAGSDAELAETSNRGWPPARIHLNADTWEVERVA